VITQVLLVAAALLLSGVGIAVAIDWKGLAQRYTDFTLNMTPSLPWGIFDPRKRERRQLVQTRVIFAVIALLGLGLLLTAFV
jgi:hypothetical protein